MSRITAGSQEALLEAINSDPEFRIAARYWNGSFRLGMGPDEAYLFRVRDGRLVWDFEVSGPADGWRQLLSAVPPPFYQDVASAVLRHGFTLGGDVESFFAYHAALRRVIDVMRHATSP
jgi:hypothetical protein